MNKDKIFHICLFISLISLIIWSFIRPYSYVTWILEAFPIILIIIILIKTYNKFTFTNITYILIWISLFISLIGAHYTYPKVPLFNWLKDIYNLSRNHYDRLAHISYGFTGAITIREFFIRKSILKKKNWISSIALITCLAISSCYELIEFAIAKTARNTQDFLGFQGDIWDTQWDMFCVLIGALIALLSLRKYHSKKINEKLHF